MSKLPELPSVNHMHNPSSKIKSIIKYDLELSLKKLKSNFQQAQIISSIKQSRWPYLDLLPKYCPQLTPFHMTELNEEELPELLSLLEVIDELTWYLKTTEDMSSTLETAVKRFIKRLEDQSFSLFSVFDHGEEIR